MPALPSTLALTTIQTSSQILSADHRNNNTAIQTGWNSLIGILDDGAAGDVLTGVGSTIAYAKPPGYEYAYSEITATVTVSGTSGAQTTVIGPTTGVTFDGGTVIYLELFCPQVSSGAADSVIFEAYEDATSIGLIAVVSATAAGASTTAPVSARRRRTPSAASHTYTVKAYRAAVNGSVLVGAGGAGTQVPAYLRIVKA